MSPEAVRLLDRLGVVADLEAAGAVPLEGTTVIGARGSRLTGLFREAELSPVPSRRTFPPPPHPRRPPGRAPRARPGRRCGNAPGSRRCSTTAARWPGALVRGPDGRHTPIRARLTIGADGLGSLVARRLGRQRRTRPQRVAFVAHLSGIAGMGRTAEMHVGDAGYVGLNRVGADLYNVALVVPQARAAGARGDATRFFFEALETLSRRPRTGRRPAPGAGGPGDRTLCRPRQPGERAGARCWSATRPISSIPSPDRGSTPRSAAPSSPPRPPRARCACRGPVSGRGARRLSAAPAAGLSSASGRSSD